MIAVTGDETGLVKLIDISANRVSRYGEQARSYAVKGLSYIGDGQIVALKASSLLDLYSLKTEQKSKSSSYTLSLDGSYRIDLESPIGLVEVYGHSYSQRNLLLSYNKEGDVSINRAPVGSSIDAGDGCCDLDEVMRMTVRAPLSACAACDKGILFAGKENDTQLFDLQDQKVVWGAKNVSQNALHLRVPVWVTSLSCQLQQATSTSGHVKFFAGTAYKHVRLYDTGASQRPVASLELEGDYRVSAVCAGSSCGSAGEWGLYVADTSGAVTYWDMRTQRSLSSLRGATGCVRAVALGQDCSQDPYSSAGRVAATAAATVGLDRFLRIYSAETHQLESSYYLKNRLNCCLLMDVQAESNKSKRAKDTLDRTGDGSGSGGEDLLQEYADSDSDSNSDPESDSHGGNESDSANDRSTEGSKIKSRMSKTQIEEKSDEQEEEEEEEEEDPAVNHRRPVSVGTKSGGRSRTESRTARAPASAKRARVQQ